MNTTNGGYGPRMSILAQWSRVKALPVGIEAGEWVGMAAKGRKPTYVGATQQLQKVL
jgi:hypothetical protein